MQREELVQLDRLAERSLAEIEEVDSDLAGALIAEATEALRTTIEDRLADASEEVRAVVEKTVTAPLTGGSLRDEILTASRTVAFPRRSAKRRALPRPSRLLRRRQVPRGRLAGWGR